MDPNLSAVKMYVALVFAVLLSGCACANVNKHMKLLEMDNNIEPNLIPSRTPRRFLALTQAPEAVTTHKQGTTITLTCEAFASPAPSIRWFKNNQPIYEYYQESNEIFDTNPTSLARLSSTLLVSRTEGRDEYTCVATAAAKTARAHAVVYSDGSTSLLDRVRLIPLAPQILVSYKVLMDLIGSSVVLPCHAKGHPRPQITWTNNVGATVKRDPRMKVLRSGELVISPLLWTDMGEFTCQASNSFGTATTTTFVYPASVSRMNKIKH